MMSVTYKILLPPDNMKCDFPDGTVSKIRFRILQQFRKGPGFNGKFFIIPVTEEITNEMKDAIIQSISKKTSTQANSKVENDESHPR